MKQRWLIFVSVLLLAGCTLPQWRVFQAKVPEEKGKPAAQVEAERSAASYIAQKSAAPEPDPVAQVAAIHEVAVPLSSSLGEPKKPVVVTEDKDAIITSLRKGVLAEQQKAEQWRRFAIKYANKPLEDTGFNLAGPAGLLALIAFAAACVVFPAFGYLVLRVIPVLWGFFSRTTSAIGEFVQENPDAGDQLKTKLSRKMDEAHKKLVRIRKANA